MTAANPDLALAVATGRKRYVGVVCSKHPELSGERNVRNRGCLGCNRDKMRARRASNPEYYRQQGRVTYQKHREVYLERGGKRGRLRRTGIDHETFLKLLALQDGKCALCRSELKQRPHADHCHETGKARGILCGPCNQAEGLIKRSGLSVEDFSKRLSAYLKNPPADSLK